MRRFLFFILAFSFAIPLSTYGSTLPESEPNFRFAIDTLQSYLGAEVEVAIRNVSEPAKPGVGKGNAIGSFSFLVNYDDSQLDLLGVWPGQILKEKGWEVFNTQVSVVCTLGGGCHEFGPILIRGIADSKYEKGHPYLSRQDIGEWLVLRFRVENNCLFSGQTLPVSWVWGNCNDNTLTNFTSNRVWVVDSLINLVGNPLDLKTVFPLDISSCDTLSFGDRKVHAEQGITFVNGGIGLPLSEDCEGIRGDLNLNGLQYEIADYILYQNYFLYGDSVLFSDPIQRQLQLVASDVNGDNHTLRVADLVYLARVIMGDNYPLPKTVLDTLGDSAFFSIYPTSTGLIVSTFCKQDIGGVFLRFKSSFPFGIPSILDTAVNLVLSYHMVFGELRVLLSPGFDTDSAKIPFGQQNILFIPSKGQIDSIQFQVSTYDGRELPAKLKVVEGTKFRIAIDTLTAAQGTDLEVAIRNISDATDSSLANGKSVGGFSFLLNYDCLGLQFLSARKGALLVRQGWEFFSYRIGGAENCDCSRGCPACPIRIDAIADINNGAQLPVLDRKNMGEWAVLKFRTGIDSTMVGRFAFIYWVWCDCRDNTISDSTRSRLWLVDSLYTAFGTRVHLSGRLPFDIFSCGTDSTVVSKRFVIFSEGGVWLTRPTDMSVDLDLNGQKNQVGVTLSQNFPNPFNPSTSFTLSLPKSGRYSVRIYNLAGQVVKSFEGEAPAGRQVLTWDGTDQNGKPVSSGIYFYKANAAGYSETKKMILIR